MKQPLNIIGMEPTDQSQDIWQFLKSLNNGPRIPMVAEYEAQSSIVFPSTLISESQKWMASDSLFDWAFQNQQSQAIPTGSSNPNNVQAERHMYLSTQLDPTGHTVQYSHGCWKWERGGPSDGVGWHWMWYDTAQQ